MSNNTPEKRIKLVQKIEGYFRTKYMALIVSILLMLSGVLTLIIGVKNIAEAVLIIAGHQEGKPGVYIIESVDTFLFALVIFILAGGIFKLFVGNENTLKDSMVFSRIHNFMDLKVLLWETLLLTLSVWCSLGFFLQTDTLTYDLLIFPAAIVLLALALKLMKGNNHQ